MEETKYHPALRFIEVGRGYGVTRVPVVTFGSAGRSTMLHIIEWQDEGEFRALCGTKAGITELYEDVDPKAVRHAGANVCYRCRKSLGRVPMPHLKSDSDPMTDIVR